jgi:hypothetical protein
MRAVMTVRANDRYTHAIRATTDLLSRLKLTFAFVGNVARSAWLGTSVESGSIDVLALMSPEQKNNVAMMASNRGFRVDRAEIEQSEELDLIPLNVEEIRVHVLVASNALYARMVTGAVEASLGERPSRPQSLAAGETPALRVVSAEDLALLMSLAEDPAAELLVRLPDFDRRAYNERLISIGLSQLVVAE